MKTLLLGIILLVASATGSDARNHEMDCLALNIYFEAGNQSDLGMVWVGDVVMNRVDSRSFPNTICKVVWQWKWKTKKNKEGKEYKVKVAQFSWTKDGKFDTPFDQKSWKKAQDIAYEVVSNWVLKSVSPEKAYWPAGDSMWYHADYVKPIWRLKLNFLKKIDNHLFYEEK